MPTVLQTAERGPCASCKRAAALGRDGLCRRCFDRLCAYAPAPVEREE